jgi:ribA/ribD-fused uncharacterized protein
MENEIWFYDPKKPYGVFSNFKETKMVIDGVIYYNSEAYFQSKKFTGPDATPADLEYANLIASQKTGGKPAILARQKKPTQNYPWAKELWVTIQEYQKKGVSMRPDWDKVKDNVMRCAVYNKFAQNLKFKKVLLDTGNAQLFEHTFRDDYWADGHPRSDPGVHGDGLNMLGKILEEVRYRLGGEMSDRYDSLIIEGG